MLLKALSFPEAGRREIVIVGGLDCQKIGIEALEINSGAEG